MHSYAQKPRDNPSPADRTGEAKLEGDTRTTLPNLENHPAAVAQRKLQAALNQSPQAQSLVQMQAAMNQSSRVAAMTQLAVTLQSKPAAPVVQRQEVNEEELQMQPEPVAPERQGLAEDEEPLQGKFETAQRQPSKDEELLQGRFVTAQHQALEHPLIPLTYPASASADQATVQRVPIEYQDKTGNTDMKTLAGWLSDDVDTAKAIVDSNPLLNNVPGRDTGYLATWVDAFTAFTNSAEGNVPPFFYARYGYAIETLATRMFKSRDHKGYKVGSQATYGSTRPDFVIQDNLNNDIAWLDTTSSASVGHIYGKQGGGWKTRPYIAEIVYDMPAPTDFASTAKGSLTTDQLKALQSADVAQGLREVYFDRGMKAMSVILGEAYASAYQKKGSGLSATDVKEVTKTKCKEYLGKFDPKAGTPKYAAGVLTSIDSLEVTGAVFSGLSWADWAFGKGVANRAMGRALLLEFGKPEKKEEEQNEEMMSE